MRRLRQLDKYRLRHPIAQMYGDVGDDHGGVFSVTREGGARLHIIASTGEGWDHLSVSLADRTPTWAEMDHVKRMFFRPDEVAFQLHVSAADHISIHDHCLHLWRPQKREIPLPPKRLV